MSTPAPTGSIYESEDFVVEIVTKWFEEARGDFPELDETVAFSDATPEAQDFALGSYRRIIQLTATTVEKDMEMRLWPHKDDVGEIYLREDGEFGFRVLAGNHENIGGSGSEGYTRPADAERALFRLRPDITDVRFVDA